MANENQGVRPPTETEQSIAASLVVLSLITCLVWPFYALSGFPGYMAYENVCWASWFYVVTGFGTVIVDYFALLWLSMETYKWIRWALTTETEKPPPPDDWGS